MKRRAVLILGLSLVTSAALAQDISMVRSLPMDVTGPYGQNRAPLAPAPLQKLPIGSIRPQGWLGHQLVLEANGLAGRLYEVSRFVKYEGNGWVEPAGKGGWEELPYWIKGLGDLGYVQHDERVITKARRWIDGIIAAQQADGWFGPDGLKTSIDGRPDLWPHMPVLNAMQSWYEYSGDPRVLPFMTNYFKWLDKQPVDTYSLGYWPKLRWGDCLGSVHWLYNRTGEQFLLGLAKKMHDHSAKWSEGIANGHNVNFAQGFREPAQYAVQSKLGADRQAAYRNYDEMMGRYGQFPGGGFAGDENTRPNYTDARQGFETCGIVEYMSSFELLTGITGDPVWAERCEHIAFNSLPAAMTPDLKALHYLTAANQVQLDRYNKAPGIDNSGTMFSFSPNEVYRCCQHNHTMGWPYYSQYLYMATNDGGLLANLYSASQVTAKVGANAASVTISQTTNYPFSEDIHFKVSIPSGSQVSFPLYLRIPTWAVTSLTSINGKALPLAPGDGSSVGYLRVVQNWKDGDEVSLHLAMKVEKKTWPKAQGNSVSLFYGPLAFAYSPGEKWVRYGGTDSWPEHEVFAASAFNYGLDIPDIATIKVEHKTDQLPAQPFTPESAPLSMTVPARKIAQWKIDENNLLHTMQASPAFTDAPVELIKLIPMGAARLKISSFPVASTSPTATVWKAPPVMPRVSHCFHGDTPLAIVDGVLPSSSNDTSLPRFTWWDHKGSTEWIELPVDPASAVSSTSVYWYDDAPDGGCRPPESWTVLYKDGDDWKPVENATEAGCEINRFNKITFNAVHTTSLRVQAKLAAGYSAGILEARVNDATPAGALK